jgi:hypothetical protein
MLTVILKLSLTCYNSISGKVTLIESSTEKKLIIKFVNPAIKTS